MPKSGTLILSAENPTTSPRGGVGVAEGPTPPPRVAPAHPDARHVLLIDDNASLRSAVACWLRLAGHTVVEAERGDAGVRAFVATAVDLVVTDLEMPGLTGWEVARAVRACRPTVPVVLITGNPEAAEAAPALRALVQAILLKPFGGRALIEVIKGLTAVGALAAPAERTEPGAGLPSHDAAPRDARRELERAQEFHADGLPRTFAQLAFRGRESNPHGASPAGF